MSVREPHRGTSSQLRRGLAVVPERTGAPAPPPPVLAEPESSANLRRDWLYRRALAAADVISAAAAIMASLVVLGDDTLRLALLLALPLIVVVGKLLGLYDRDEHVLYKGTLEEAPRLFSVATLYALLMALGSGILYEGDLGHAQLVALWGLLFALMIASRALARVIVTRAIPPERCLVLGSASAAARVREKFDSTDALNAVVIGRVPFASDTEHHNPTVLGGLDALAEILATHHVQRVIVAPSVDDGHGADSDHILDSIRLATSLGVRVSVLPRLFEVVGSSVRLDDAYGMLLLGLPRYGLGRSSSALKRGFDIAVAGIGLLALMPLLVMIAISIKATSRGPILFKQRRIGRGGNEFEMLKFRSMCVDAEDLKDDLRDHNEAGAGLFKIDADPRITRVGEVLRRLSLDELPQLVNVVRGDMSLVGPRPLVPEDDRWIEGWDRRRLHMPPGMTGVWQILGSSRVPLPEMVKIDYHYGATWSVWLDLKILLRTVSYVVARRGI